MNTFVFVLVQYDLLCEAQIRGRGVFLKGLKRLRHSSTPILRTRTVPGKENGRSMPVTTKTSPDLQVQYSSGVLLL